MIDSEFLEKARNDRKLQLTDNNLVRVAAIVCDLEVRIKALEKGKQNKKTPKAIRRARTRLLAKAKVEVAERKIALSDAVCDIIERCDEPELIIRAFSKIKGKKQSSALAPNSPIPGY